MHEFFQLPYPYMVPNGTGLRVSAPAMPPYSEPLPRLCRSVLSSILFEQVESVVFLMTWPLPIY